MRKDGSSRSRSRGYRKYKEYFGAQKVGSSWNLKSSLVSWRVEVRRRVNSGWKLCYCWSWTWKKTKKEINLAFVHYMGCIPPHYSLDKVLRWVSLRWSNEENANGTLAKRAWILGGFIKAGSNFKLSRSVHSRAQSTWWEKTLFSGHSMMAWHGLSDAFI